VRFAKSINVTANSARMRGFATTGLGYITVGSKLLPCERCGASVDLLIFAPGATDPGSFKDYALWMHPQVVQMHMPTYVIGPALKTTVRMDEDGEAHESAVGVLAPVPVRSSMPRATRASRKSSDRSVEKSNCHHIH